MKYLKVILISLISAFIVSAIIVYADDTINNYYYGEQSFGAPQYRPERTLQPEVDNEYYIGSTTPVNKRWKGLNAVELLVASSTVQGQSTAEYFTATSTTATSTFPNISVTNLDTAFTQGSSIFAGVDGILTQDKDNYFYDDTNNNLGIGSSTPWGKLSVTNTSSNPSFIVEDSASPDGTSFVVDESGNVGIGTTSPFEKLSVTGNQALTGVLEFAGSNSISSGGAYGKFAGNDLWGMQMWAGNGVATDWSLFDRFGNLAITLVGLNFSIGTNGGGETYIQANGGNVGIGTSIPYAKLSVWGDGTGTGKALEIVDNASTTRMVVLDNGKVGIATSSPAHLFSLAGDFYSTGRLIYQPSAEQSVTAGGGITSGEHHLRVQGSGGAVTITANPQISAGFDGEEIIIEGGDDTNTVTIVNGNGVHLHGGSAILSDHDYVKLVYSSDDAQWEEVSRNFIKGSKSWAFSSPSGGGQTFYIGGHYEFNSGNSTFVGGVNFGTANKAEAAHAFLVAGASPSSDSVVRVSGTSITDGGVATASDTEDITFLSTASANDFKETDKKWLGQITITWISGDNTVNYNYGFNKYWDNNNSNFRVLGLEATWLAGNVSNSFEINLYKQQATGWNYNAGSTPTPPTPLATMSTDHTDGAPTTFDQTVANENGAWKRDNLNATVQGGDGEGTIIEIITNNANQLRIGNFELQIRAD